MKIILVRHVSWFLVFAMFVIGVAPRVDGAMVPSDVIGSYALDRTADLAKLQRVLEIKAVKERLVKFGFTAGEINMKLDNLNDSQVHQLARQIDDLRVGGDTLGVLIPLLVVVALVLIILQFTGHRVIVTS